MCGYGNIILRKDTGNELIGTDAIDAIAAKISGKPGEVTDSSPFPIKLFPDTGNQVDAILASE